MSFLEETLDTLDNILNNRINIIQASREIGPRCIEEMGIPFDMISIFILIDSDTDHYPIGNVRNKWDPKELEKLDKEMDDYIEWIKPKLFEDCRILKEALLKIQEKKLNLIKLIDETIEGKTDLIEAFFQIYSARSNFPHLPEKLFINFKLTIEEANKIPKGKEREEYIPSIKYHAFEACDYLKKVL